MCRARESCKNPIQGGDGEYEKNVKKKKKMMCMQRRRGAERKKNRGRGDSWSSSVCRRSRFLFIPRHRESKTLQSTQGCKEGYSSSSSFFFFATYISPSLSPSLYLSIAVCPFCLRFFRKLLNERLVLVEMLWTVPLSMVRI